MCQLHIIDIVQSYENTATCPILCKLSNGLMAVVKLINNVQGNKSLVNQFIAYKLAKLFNKPIPDAGVINLEKDFGKPEIISSENFGPCFYSSFISKTVQLQ